MKTEKAEGVHEGNVKRRRLLTSKEAAEYLGISDGYLRLSRSTGATKGRMSPPPHIRIGRGVRYDVKDLDTWISLQPRYHTSNECDENDLGR